MSIIRKGDLTKVYFFALLLATLPFAGVRCRGLEPRTIGAERDYLPMRRYLGQGYRACRFGTYERRPWRVANTGRCFPTSQQKDELLHVRAAYGCRDLFGNGPSRAVNPRLPVRAG